MNIFLMNQTICFSDYKFDIELVNTSINIKVFNTTSLDLYEGSVNEAEIYIQPISKFYKMLISGLNKENNFNFEINKLTDKLKCQLNYLNELGMDNVAKHEQDLTSYALEKFLQLDKVEVIGPKNNIDRGSVISFTIDGIHPHDVGQALDQYGVAVRTGHHCAWPLMRKLGLVGTTRASFYVYNDEADVDTLIESILEAQKYFKV
jgi:hypothetical protein